MRLLGRPPTTLSTMPALRTTTVDLHLKDIGGWELVEPCLDSGSLSPLSFLKLRPPTNLWTLLQKPAPCATLRVIALVSYLLRTDCIRDLTEWPPPLVILPSRRTRLLGTPWTANAVTTYSSAVATTSVRGVAAPSVAWATRHVCTKKGGHVLRVLVPRVRIGLLCSC